MTPEQKLARIEELLEERARINTELLAILDAAPEDELPERSVGPKRKGSKKGGRKCGKCGQVGHRADHCTAENGATASDRGERHGARLSEDQFLDLKALQKSGELSTREFASDHELDLSEVNSALNFRRYEDYVR